MPMNPNVTWRGVYPAALTQFNSDYSVNIPATLDHLDVMMEAGVHGFIMLGTCGENNSLEPDEKIQILKATVEHVNRRVPVLTGVSELSTARAARFAEKAQAAGVDGLMVLPAMAYRSDRRETIQHFRTVAKASDLPVMIYNNPVSYLVDVTVDMLRELADESSIVAVKESSDDIRRITDVINGCRDRYIVFCGVDDLALESFMLGATGWISGLVSAFPRENRMLWDLAQEGKWEAARGIYRWYTPCLHLDTKVKLVQYIKLAAQECGYGTETVRPPRLPLVGAEREEILGIVRQAIKTRPKASK